MASVLIIEDEDRLRRILTLNLARRGYTVAEADSVEAAIEALETFPEPFDLLLLDINLPDQTGWDVMRYLVRRAETSPAGDGRRPQVIVMTAVRPAQGRLDEFRPAAVLLKPFPIEALARLVARTLTAPAQTDAGQPEAAYTSVEVETPGDDEGAVQPRDADAGSSAESAPPAGQNSPTAAAG
jgi:CheY-like chemotaxis protein